MAVVRAAGGLLWRDGVKGRSGAHLALIHRPHRRDWSLPKGKLHEGETWEACALREVREETGCEGRIASFAGVMTYVPRDNPKIVLYWHMEMIREGRLDSKFKDEIDDVVWLSPKEALERLDYEGERRIVERFQDGLAEHILSVRSSTLTDEVLSAELAALRADLYRRVLSLGKNGDPAGLGPAFDLVAAAEGAAASKRDVEVAMLLASARRMALLSMPDSERSLRARVLLEEAKSLSMRPRRAIESILTGPKTSSEALFVAAELLDQARARRAVRAVAKVRMEPPSPRWKVHHPWALGAIAVLVLIGLALAQPFSATLVATAVASAIVGGAAGLLVGRR